MGYWKVSGDCRDYSGKDNHGTNRNVNLDTGEFNGKSSYIDVKNNGSLNFGSGDFSICAAVYTEKDIDGVIGDIISKYDASRRKGINLCLKASSGGYNSQGSDKHILFGIDDDKLGDWEDCGRPNENSNYVNSLTVFDGKLYAGTTDAERVEDWAHVYRYERDGKWADCGRLGDQRVRGVGPMLVHNGELYAATWIYEFGERRKREIASGLWDYCSVYRYREDKEWEKCGQPGQNHRLNSIASYKGKLYVAGDGATIDPERRCYVYEEGQEWRTCGEFEDLPHCMALHDGKLYLGSSGGGEVYAYDGEKWERLEKPFGYSPVLNEATGRREHICTQIHAMEVYRGELYVGCWPNGNVAVLRNGKWEDCGSIGDKRDQVEINALTVYNGKLYGGSLPRAGVWRYDGNGEWKLLRKLFDGKPAVSEGNEWTRLTSLTVYDGRLFATVGSCTGSVRDAPIDVRGKVFCIEAGKNASYDYDLGPGWKHIAAVKDDGRLKLYINGELKVTSPPFDSKDYNVSTDTPLRIGFGELDYFSGKIREIRLYSRSLTDEQVKTIYKKAKDIMR